MVGERRVMAAGGAVVAVAIASAIAVVGSDDAGQNPAATSARSIGPSTETELTHQPRGRARRIPMWISAGVRSTRRSTPARARGCERPSSGRA